MKAPKEITPAEYSRLVLRLAVLTPAKRLELKRQLKWCTCGQQFSDPACTADEHD